MSGHTVSEEAWPKISWTLVAHWLYYYEQEVGRRPPTWNTCEKGSVRRRRQARQSYGCPTLKWMAEWAGHRGGYTLLQHVSSGRGERDAEFKACNGDLRRAAWYKMTCVVLCCILVLCWLTCESGSFETVCGKK